MLSEECLPYALRGPTEQNSMWKHDGHDSLRAHMIKDFASTWKRSILRVWGIGFASDFLGALLILAVELIRSELYPDWNTFYFPRATLIAIPGVILSAICIYCLDKRYAFVKTNLSEPAIKKLSMALSVFTAPYAMLIPLYG